MSHHPGTVTVWQSGRLAPRTPGRRVDFTRQQAIGAALLALSACVLAMFIAVLEQDVDRNELLHAEQRSRVVAAQSVTGPTQDDAVDSPRQPARGETVSLMSVNR